MSRLASSAGMAQAAAVPGVAPYAVPGLATAPGGMPTILPGGLLAPAAVLPGVLPAAAVAAVPGLAGAVDMSLHQGLLGPASPIPTPCLLLKNMFDPATQTEPDWVTEVGEDVRDECSKFGQVFHTHVDKDSKVRPAPAGPAAHSMQ